jgi:CrcB protein
VKPVLFVAAGGAMGSVLRWLASSGVQKLLPHASFPWGTLAVNVIGSFAIGAIMTMALERSSVSPDARLFLVTGVLGGFTTFSALSWDTLVLLRSGATGPALGYALGSLVLGVAAAFAGAALALRA